MGSVQGGIDSTTSNKSNDETKTILDALQVMDTKVKSSITLMKVRLIHCERSSVN